MNAAPLRPLTFRPRPTIADKLAAAQAANMNLSELINDVLEKHLSSTLKAKSDALRKAVAALPQ